MLHRLANIRHPRRFATHILACPMDQKRWQCNVHPSAFWVLCHTAPSKISNHQRAVHRLNPTLIQWRRISHFQAVSIACCCLANPNTPGCHLAAKHMYGHYRLRSKQTCRGRAAALNLGDPFPSRTENHLVLARRHVEIRQLPRCIFRGIHLAENSGHPNIPMFRRSEVHRCGSRTFR